MGLRRFVSDLRLIPYIWRGLVNAARDDRRVEEVWQEHEASMRVYGDSRRSPGDRHEARGGRRVPRPPLPRPDWSRPTSFLATYQERL